MKSFMGILLSVSFFSPLLMAEEKFLPKDSLYQSASKWKDQNDQTISLGKFSGKPVIITMVYTGCDHACPMTIAKVQDIEQALQKKGFKEIQYILVSFDTKKDNPSSLKRYMSSRRLKEENWTFLSTPEEKTARELAVVLGISYKAIGKGDFSHSNVISYLDKSGVIQSKIESLNADISPLIKSAEDEIKNSSQKIKLSQMEGS